MAETSAPPDVVARRVRNRIIEHLELASSFTEQRAYQEHVPYVSVPIEVINDWGDWFVVEQQDAYGPPTYTPEEHEALLRYHHVWEQVADDTPNPLPPLEETLQLPEWATLRDAAEGALDVFRRRGKLPED